jgi:hypothetical protein
MIVLGPPIAQISIAVGLAALIVKAVTDFVTNCGADASAVGRIVQRELKKGGGIAAGNTTSFIRGL